MDTEPKIETEQEKRVRDLIQQAREAETRELAEELLSDAWFMADQGLNIDPLRQEVEKVQKEMGFIKPEIKLPDSELLRE